jgi:hypothetical protein
MPFFLDKLNPYCILGTSGGEKWERMEGPVFLGQFQHTIDTKGRVSIPVKFREILAERYEETLSSLPPTLISAWWLTLWKSGA